MAFSLPFFKKKPEKEVYFGIYLGEGKLAGFVFDAFDQGVEIIAQNSYDTSTGFATVLEDIDNLISDLELKTNIHLNKTIFFLHSTMLDLDTEEIKEQYKSMLSNVAKELELIPMGYIEVKDAVEEYLKKDSVLHAILLEIDPSQFGVFVYRGGRMVKGETISRTDNIGADLSKVFLSLPKSIILPAKIVVYGAQEKIEMAETLSKYKWQDSLFVQHPTIEIIKDNDLNQMLVDTFFSELSAHKDDNSGLNQSVNITDNSEAQTIKFGFMLGADVSKNTPPLENATDTKEEMKPVENNSDAPELTSSNALIDFFKNFQMPKLFKFGQNDMSKYSYLFYGIGALLILILLFFGYEYAIHKTTIELVVNSQTIVKDIDMQIPISEKKTDKLQIILHTSTAEYTDEKSTTGTRDVGEKAKGKVTIYNSDTAKKDLSKGTVLKYNTLNYLLDSDISVASSSGINADGSKQSSKVTGTVTAKEIGAEYNLESGKQLQVDELPTSLFVAFSDGAFTGGNKKQVSTVSKKDLDILAQNIKDKANGADSEGFKSKIPSSELLIPQLTTSTTKGLVYSKELSEEAQKVSVKATGETDYYTIETSLLKDKIYKLVKEKQANGYNIDKEHIAYKVTVADKNKDDTVDVTVQGSLKKYKSFDVETLKSVLKMSSASNLEAKLRETKDIKEVRVTKSIPDLPFLSSWTPFFKKNISIEISVK